MAKFIIKEEGIVTKFLVKIFDSIVQNKTDRLKAQLHSDPALVKLVDDMAKNADEINQYILANSHHWNRDYHRETK